MKLPKRKNRKMYRRFVAALYSISEPKGYVSLAFDCTRINDIKIAIKFVDKILFVVTKKRNEIAKRVNELNN